MNELHICTENFLPIPILIWNYQNSWNTISVVSLLALRESAVDTATPRTDCGRMQKINRRKQKPCKISWDLRQQQTIPAPDVMIPQLGMCKSSVSVCKGERQSPSGFAFTVYCECLVCCRQRLSWGENYCLNLWCYRLETCTHSQFWAATNILLEGLSGWLAHKLDLVQSSDSAQTPRVLQGWE